jgi:hypothetical protein
MKWRKRLNGLGTTTPDEKPRISIIGARTYLMPEDKPSEVVREVVVANDDFIAKLLGFFLSIVVAGGLFSSLYFFSKLH